MLLARVRTVRLRDPETESFRTSPTLAEHSELLTTIREQQRTAFGNIDSLVGTKEQPIADRLDTIGRVLFVLSRTQGVGPNAA